MSEQFERIKTVTTEAIEKVNSSDSIGSGLGQMLSTMLAMEGNSDYESSIDPTDSNLSMKTTIVDIVDKNNLAEVHLSTPGLSSGPGGENDVVLSIELCMNFETALEQIDPEIGVANFEDKNNGNWIAYVGVKPEEFFADTIEITLAGDID